MFGLSKRAVAIIFGLLAVAFALGAILLFTPQAGPQPRGKPVLWVNDKPVYELDLLRLQGNDPLYGANPEGLLRVLVDTYFLGQVILTEALRQDARRVRVTNAEVRQEVDRIREQFGLKEKAAYDRFLNQIGYTDAQLRGEIRAQLQIQQRLEQIRNGAKPTPEEVAFYFEVHQEDYRTEPRVLARQIVVDDKALAQDLARRARAGEDFAALARAHSKVGAEAGGALGAEPGTTIPRPVTRVVFPEEVAGPVFALGGPGIVGPLEAGGRYYLVKVEAYEPPRIPSFEEVKARVEEDAKRVKGEQAVEAYLETLRRQAKVRFAEGTAYTYKDPVVARVNGEEIRLTEILGPVLGNNQVVALIQQGLGELVVQLLLPQTLDGLIDRELLLQAAKASGKPFIGTKDEIAQAYGLWATRDLTVREEEARAFYTRNPALFTVPATAKVVGVVFKEETKAKAFREAALRSEDLQGLAKAHGGTVTEYGTVSPNQLPQVLDRLVFKVKESFPRGPLGEVSEVVKQEDGTYLVLLVSDRKPEELRPFPAVRWEAEARVLASKRQERLQVLLKELRDQARVEDNLEAVLAELTPKREERPAQPQEVPSQKP